MFRRTYGFWAPSGLCLAMHNAMTPSAADRTDSTRQNSPGEVSGGNDDEIGHENAGNGVATRTAEAQNARPSPRDSTEGMPDREANKAANVSTNNAAFVQSRNNFNVEAIIHLTMSYLKTSCTAVHSTLC